MPAWFCFLPWRGKESWSARLCTWKGEGRRWNRYRKQSNWYLSKYPTEIAWPNHSIKEEMRLWPPFFCEQFKCNSLPRNKLVGNLKTRFCRHNLKFCLDLLDLTCSGIRISGDSNAHYGLRSPDMESTFQNQ